MLRLLLFLVSLSLAFSAPQTDAAIESAIRAKFAKSKINEEHFKVSVRQGVALIEGKTSVPQRKGVATRLAKTGGAREVVNKIEISEAARAKLTERLQKAREKKAAAPKPAATPPKPAAAAPSPARAAVPVAKASLPTAEPEPIRRMQIKR